MDNRQNSPMMKVATFIVDKKIFFFVLFAVLAVFSAVASRWVEVKDLLTDYLADDTETRQGLDIMDREFMTYGTARVMLENISFDQALHIQEKIENIEGVKSVEFDGESGHYAGTAALFDVSFDGRENDEVSIAALGEVNALLEPYDVYVYSNVGNPLKTIVDKEMLIVDAVSVAIIVFIMLFTSKTYAEIPVLLITFGNSALLNMGTNFLFSPISFVTDSIAIVLQLALGIDYAIILCHRYLEEHETKPPREAAIVALSKAIPEISGSSLTTVGGLLALCFMHYKLGLDMGVVLIKAVLLSLCSVFLLMPGLLVVFAPWLDKTRHTSLVPKISFLGRFAYKTRFVVPPLFAVVLVAACIFSGKANYVYNYHSVDSIRHNDNQLAERHINETFGTTNQFVIIVPSGDFEREAALTRELGELSRTVEVTALTTTEAKDGYLLTDAVSPRQFSEIADIDYEAAQVIFTGYSVENDEYGKAVTNIDGYRIPLLDVFTYLNDQRDKMALNLREDTAETLDDLAEQLDDARLQLMSDNYSRIVAELDLPIEKKVSYDYVNILHGLCAKYYDEYYVIGETVSCNDLSATFLNDNRLISILSVTFVILVLIFTFKSAGLPVLLIIIIQGSIWINFSTPYIRGENLYFLTYLIISAIQMGANIDYAIVISSRYMELKERLPLQEAMVETLNGAFPTIITSGVIMACAGVAIGFIASNETISAIGVYLGTGTSISIILVMCVLPQILLLGDTILQKTQLHFDGLAPRTHTGLVRVDGRVVGHIEGFVDAEMHGFVRGTVNATVTLGGSAEEVDLSQFLKETDTAKGEWNE